MRTNKLTFCLSLLVAIIFLGLYLIFTFVCPNGVCQDIFIAIFSSSIFVIATSIIGYSVEKYRLKRACVDRFYEIRYEIEIINTYCNCGISISELSRTLKKIRSNYYKFYNLIANYYADCFCKKFDSNTPQLIKSVEQSYNDLGNTEKQILEKSDDEVYLKNCVETIFNRLNKLNSLIFYWLVIQKAVAYNKQKIKDAKVKFNENN